MVLRLEQLAGINAGEIGASALQKEAMRISKIDTLSIESIRVKDDNPLATVECLMDVIFVDNKVPREPGKPIPLEQTEVGQAIASLFSDKYMNRGELFPLAIRDGTIVVKIQVQMIEALVHAST